MCNGQNFMKVILIISVIVQITSGYTFYNKTRYPRQSDCGFKCALGECIDSGFECDGNVDCADGSDETDNCLRLRCAPYTFKCAYGACINKDFECNGVQNCRDNSDENSANCNLTRSTCRSKQFQCNSRQCIPEEQKCDGKADCNDTSDETLTVCNKIKCPLFSYKCAYGACVDGDTRCNGVKDCHDGSDELNCNNSSPSPPITPVSPTPVSRLPVINNTPGSCILPEHPKGGRWSFLGPLEKSPGDEVDPFTVLTITCNSEFKHIGNNVTYCIGGLWTHSIGICEKLCPPYTSDSIRTVTCTREDFIANCSQPRENTIAKFSCKPFYELDSRRSQRVCVNGIWDDHPPRCVPICGLKTGKARTLIIGGNDATPGDYPWHVALYNSTQHYICGGSLISNNAIITAAHCVTNLNTSEILSEDSFTVAAGKYFSFLNDTRDTEAEFLTLKKIYVPANYGGDDFNYQSDIALLLTTKNFKIGKRIQPVCIDWEGYFEEILFSNFNATGLVPGWGSTREGGKISASLKEVYLPYVPYSECRTALPSDFRIYLTPDKICSGFLSKGVSVCQGDSGGGLVFQNLNDGRYYLTGVVSVSPPSTETGSCDSQQYSLYTKVTKYIRFILERTA